MLFFTLTLVPVVILDTTPNKVSLMENRELQNLPTFNDHPDFSPGGKLIHFVWDFETYIKDRIGFRESIVQAWSITKLAFGGVSGKLQTLGKKGWIFRHDFNNTAYLKGGKDTIVKTQIRVSEYYKLKNVDYIYVIPPAKSEVYPEYLPNKFTAKNIPDTEDLVAALNTAGVNAVAPKEKMIEYKTQGKVYSMGDHHWSGLGSYAGYLAIIDKMNEIGYDIERINLTFSDKEAPESSGIRDLGLPGIPIGLTFIKDILPFAEENERFGYILKEGEDFDKVVEFAEKYSLVSKRSGIFINSEAKYGTLLLRGDSFFAVEYDVAKYFSAHFKKVVWLIDYKGSHAIPEVDEYFQPDIVLIENTGRSIYNARKTADLLP